MGNENTSEKKADAHAPEAVASPRSQKPKGQPSSKVLKKKTDDDDDDVEEVHHEHNEKAKAMIEEKRKELEEEDESKDKRINFTSAEDYWDKNAKQPNVKKIETQGKKAKLVGSLKVTLKATESVTDLKRNVRLPKGEDEQEWIAVNLIHFFNSLNMIFNTLAEFCTDESCPKMTSGPSYEYLWKDNNRYKKATRLSAHVYIDLLLNWANERISDPTFLPTDDETSFPPTFRRDAEDVFRRLFRVYGHIYFHHYKKIKDLGASAHLNTCFKHYVIFAKEFNLIPDSEFAPLQKLISKFID